MIKKFLALLLLLGSSVLFATPAAAGTATGDSAASVAANAASPQRYYQRQRVNRRGVRIVNRTRVVRVGYRTYREVVQYRYLPNGRVNVRVLSRTRIR